MKKSSMTSVDLKQNRILHKTERVSRVLHKKERVSRVLHKTERVSRVLHKTERVSRILHKKERVSRVLQWTPSGEMRGRGPMRCHSLAAQLCEDTAGGEGERRLLQLSGGALGLRHH